MSMKGNLTREQAVAIVGETAVDEVESENCEPTNRVGYNGACQGNSLTEWSASKRCQDTDGIDVTLIAYYYTSNAQDKVIAETGDAGFINWEIAGFEVA